MNDFKFVVQADRRGGIFVTTDRDTAERFATAHNLKILAPPLLTAKD